MLPGLTPFSQPSFDSNGATLSMQDNLFLRKLVSISKHHPLQRQIQNKFAFGEMTGDILQCTIEKTHFGHAVQRNICPHDSTVRNWTMKLAQILFGSYGTWSCTIPAGRRGQNPSGFFLVTNAHDKITGMRNCSTRNTHQSYDKWTFSVPQVKRLSL